MHDTGGDAGWMAVPIILSFLAYISIALFVWPYTRPRFPVIVFVFCILFPPAFFVLSAYLLVTLLSESQQTVVFVSRPPIVRSVATV